MNTGNVQLNRNCGEFKFEVPTSSKFVHNWPICSIALSSKKLLVPETSKDLKRMPQRKRKALKWLLRKGFVLIKNSLKSESSVKDRRSQCCHDFADASSQALFVRSRRIRSIAPRWVKISSKALGGSSSNGNIWEESVPVEETESAEDERESRPSSVGARGAIPKAMPPWLSVDAWFEVVRRREETY